MKAYAVLLLLLIFVAGCVRVIPKETGKWTPAKPRKSVEELLADETGAKPEPKQVKLALSVYPQAVLTYMDVRITCNMPYVEGDYIFAASNGKFNYSGANNGQRIHYMNVGCEPFQVVCGYAEYIPPTGYEKMKTVTIDVKPVGECR